MKEELKKYFEENFPEEHQAILNSFERKPAKFIRINTLRIDKDELIERMEKDGFEFEKTIVDEVFLVKKQPYSAGASKEHLLGYFYIQDLLSVIPVLELRPRKDELVLDMTAAPGGKTTFASQLMKNDGVVVALDKKTSKLISLKSNLSRMGTLNCIVYHMNSLKVGKLGMHFDKILLDVPCSGEGNVRSNPATFKMWNLKAVEKLSRLQRKIADSAILLLKPGGELIYSTCTHSPEENELNIQYLIDKHNLEILPIDLPLKTRPGLTSWNNEKLNKNIEKACRIYPQDNDTEGFFLCKMRKGEK